MKYVSMAIVGLIVGILARFFYPGALQLGWFVSIALGIGGSFIAGFIGSLFDKQPGTAIKPAGFIASILGAMLRFSLPGMSFIWSERIIGRSSLDHLGLLQRFAA